MGVDVEDPDHDTFGPEHRHGEHRCEVLTPQRRDVHVARVGPLVVDQRRLAPLGHPSGHPFAHPEPDGTGEGVEGPRRGAGQDQPAAFGVDNMNEAGVGRGGAHHQVGRPAHNGP